MTNKFFNFNGINEFISHSAVIFLFRSFNGSN